MLTQAIRSALFYLLFIGQTAVIAITIAVRATLAGGKRTRFTWALVRYWCWSNLWLMHILVGVRTSVEGMENIPEGGCIIASKHQSDWDVFAIFPHTGRPAYIVKKELMDIPFFGNAARSLDCIEIDRKRGGDAMAGLIAQAREKLDQGCRIVIFPEGTRTAPLAEPNYKWGTTRLYEALNVPVVPVALNSGLFWGRNSLVLWPGRAKARFLPAIPPGLGKEEFQRRLVEAIEGQSDELILEAADAGIARPLNDDMLDGIDRLRAARDIPSES